MCEHCMFKLLLKHLWLYLYTRKSILHIFAIALNPSISFVVALNRRKRKYSVCRMLSVNMQSIKDDMECMLMKQFRLGI